MEFSAKAFYIYTERKRKDLQYHAAFYVLITSPYIERKFGNSMKALILSFFCVILGYSFFFDKEDTEETPVVNQSDKTDRDMKDAARTISQTDTIDYFARQGSLLYTRDASDKKF